MGRSRASEESEIGYYHCISRVVDRRFIFRKEEKEKFVALMRGYEAFCGVKIITYCVMSNHFHLLIGVPKRPTCERLPSDAELIERVGKAGGCYTAATLEQDLKGFRERGEEEAAELLREGFFAQMWDVSWFMRVLKQRFSQWYNAGHGRRGTLWEDRFKSVLVEGRGRALATMAAYIDMNPVRAKMVGDPKEYRWCGYGEAVAGKKIAREGIRLAVEAITGSKVAGNRLMAEYRRFVYAEGIEVLADEEAGVKGRRGFSQEQADAVIAAGGRLELGQALRCRVRYFCDSVVFGSREFVEEFFERNRKRFGVRRQSGARPLRQVNLPELFSLRELRSAI